jgi:hypothetical protein
MPARVNEGKPVKIHPIARKGRKRRLGKVKNAFIHLIPFSIPFWAGHSLHEIKATVKANLCWAVRAAHANVAESGCLGRLLPLCCVRGSADFSEKNTSFCCSDWSKKSVKEDSACSGRDGPSGGVWGT